MSYTSAFFSQKECQWSRISNGHTEFAAQEPFPGKHVGLGLGFWLFVIQRRRCAQIARPLIMVTMMWIKNITNTNALSLMIDWNTMKKIHRSWRKKESVFNVNKAKNSLWDRLLFHLAFVFGPFPVKFYNNCSQLLDKLFVE
jgi:hypothetical protein